MEAFALLDGVVDVYVADLKFGNNTCARQIAGVDAYMQIVTRNLLAAAQTTRLIVRHLLLPGHFECCYRPLVDWMCRHLPAAPFRVMTGYLPRWQAVRSAGLDARSAGLASPLGRRRRGSGRGHCQGQGIECNCVRMPDKTRFGRPGIRPIAGLPGSPKEIRVNLEDESSISEINILPDGRVCLFGTSQQVLELPGRDPFGRPRPAESHRLPAFNRCAQTTVPSEACSARSDGTNEASSGALRP